ncbi:hypothetical protein LCM28_25555 [Salipiger pacificus]|nr:hypothetical protein [Alloyangia pacifica]
MRQERIARALESKGIKCRQGSDMLWSPIEGLETEHRKYQGSPLFDDVARKRYKPVLDDLSDWFQDSPKNTRDLMELTIHALPARVQAMTPPEMVRNALGESRRILKHLDTRLRKEAWQNEGIEIVFLREEHKLVENDGRLEDFAHFHIVVTKGKKVSSSKFLQHFRALWAECLNELSKRHPLLFSRTQHQTKAYAHLEGVKNLAGLCTYLTKPPQLDDDTSNEAIYWLHCLVTGRPQVRCYGALEDWRKGSEVFVSEASKFYRTPAVTPGASAPREVREWRTKKAVNVDEYLKPRAKMIYDWMTDPDPEYRSQLRVHQDIADKVCDILGRTRIKMPSIQSEAGSTVRTSSDVGVDWHGHQSPCKRVKMGTAPPF